MSDVGMETNCRKIACCGSYWTLDSEDSINMTVFVYCLLATWGWTTLPLCKMTSSIQVSDISVVSVQDLPCEARKIEVGSWNQLKKKWIVTKYFCLVSIDWKTVNHVVEFVNISEGRNQDFVKNNAVSDLVRDLLCVESGDLPCV